MSDAPHVKPGDWIKVGSIDCVVASGQTDTLDVLCNPERPAVYAVKWDGEAWTFCHPMRGDYAEHYASDVTRYVELLRKGH